MTSAAPPPGASPLAFESRPFGAATQNLFVFSPGRGGTTQAQGEALGGLPVFDPTTSCGKPLAAISTFHRVPDWAGDPSGVRRAVRAGRRSPADADIKPRRLRKGETNAPAIRGQPRRHGQVLLTISGQPEDDGQALPTPFRLPEHDGQALPMPFRLPEHDGQALPTPFRLPEHDGQALPMPFRLPEHDGQALPMPSGAARIW